MSDQILKETRFSVEQKEFTIEKRQNKQGTFVRVTEEHAGRRNVICVPKSGLQEFLEKLAQTGR